MTREEAIEILETARKTYPGKSVIRDAFTLALAALQPSNEPLTLEELRKMDGEPVWVSYPNRIGEDRWYIIEKSTEAGLHVESHPHFYLGWDTYGKMWLAYRRPPEGEQAHHG